MRWKKDFKKGLLYCKGNVGRLTYLKYIVKPFLSTSCPCSLSEKNMSKIGAYLKELPLGRGCISE